jgi:hypothetical protein
MSLDLADNPQTIMQYALNLTPEDICYATLTGDLVTKETEDYYVVYLGSFSVMRWKLDRYRHLEFRISGVTQMTHRDSFLYLTSIGTKFGVSSKIIPEQDFHKTTWYRSFALYKDQMVRGFGVTD